VPLDREQGSSALRAACEAIEHQPRPEPFQRLNERARGLARAARDPSGTVGA